MSATPHAWRARRWCFRDIAGMPLTSESLRILSFSELEATLHGHNAIGTQHVLLSLIESDDGLTLAALARTGVLLPKLCALLTVGDYRTSASAGIVLGPDAAAMLAAAGKLAAERGDECIIPRDLLYAVLSTPGMAVRRLADAGVDPDALREHAARILAG